MHLFICLLSAGSMDPHKTAPVSKEDTEPFNNYSGCFRQLSDDEDGIDIRVSNAM